MGRGGDGRSSRPQGFTFGDDHSIPSLGGEVSEHERQSRKRNRGPQYTLSTRCQTETIEMVTSQKDSNPRALLRTLFPHSRSGT